MKGLDSREITIINAIHRNYQLQLENQMITQLSIYFKQSEHPEKIYSWVDKIDDTRLLANQYLDTIALKKPENSLPELAKKTSGSSYFVNKLKLLLPERVSTFLFENNEQDDDYSLFNFVTADLFSIALGNSITGILFDYFKTQFTGRPDEAQKQFSQMLEKQPELSNLIKQECEHISVELIKLFHFREMLLLGKMSDATLEPNAREEFINRAKLRDEPSATINMAIEFYFARELSKIFNSGFKSLYLVHDVEIKSELQSPFIKWLNQLSESEHIRLAFTQEIQLKFMLLSRDFLLEKMNQPGFIAKHSVFFSISTGIIAALIIGVVLGFALGGALIWASATAATIGLVLVSIGASLLIKHIDAIAYTRSKKNREQIQQSINMVNNEYLRLNQEIIDRKETSVEDIQNTHDFQQINRTFLHSIECETVARGSISGWLREYASRYRHSKAIEIDLGDEYKQIMIQSRTQTQELIRSINNNETSLLNQWIKGTRQYLNNPAHQEIIKEFELIPKIKEQVLELIAHINYIHPKLLAYYSAPISEGGLAGNESDFSHIKRLTPMTSLKKQGQNPYKHLCDTALSLYKYYEPRYATEPIFLGDPGYRHMLGISRGNYGTPITNENIDDYLNNSYAFLLSLCHKISPGLGLDPLQQPTVVKDEFVLYRMLLLKQLATLTHAEHKELTPEIKIKIKTFIQKHFNQDTKDLFDNLSNQVFLLNKEVQSATLFKNNDGFLVTDVELDNIIQALSLDMVYNSFSFKFMDVLRHYMDEFSNNNVHKKTHLFAHHTREQELNPQGTAQFTRLISQYCTNTSAFLQTAATNQALTTTNIINCYTYNVSLQIYRTQLRIIKNIKELNKPDTGSEVVQQMEFLFTAFVQLETFAKAHCMPLKETTPCAKLFNLIHSKTPQATDSKQWIKYLDSSDALIYLIDTLAEQIQLPDGTIKRIAGFFNAKINSEKLTDEKPVEPASTLESVDNSPAAYTPRIVNRPY